MRFTIFLSLLFLLVSCGDFDDKCRGKKVPKYEIPSVQSALFAPVDTFNYLMDTVNVATNNSYPYSRIGLSVGPETKVKVAKIHSGLFNEAFADCNSDGTNNDPLIDLHIYSDKAYNDTFPAGADLRRVFLFNSYGMNKRIGSIFGTIRDQDSSIVRITPEIKVIWAYLNINEYLVFTPEIPPRETGTHKFKIQLITEKRSFTIDYPALVVQN